MNKDPRTPKDAPAQQGTRLNRFLASAGVASRRGSEVFILEGRVTINGSPVSSLATTVLPGDRVAVDGQPVGVLEQVTLAFHKPRNFICSKVAEGRFRSIYEILPPWTHRLAHVGRLDAESEGLLLLTSDGDLAHKLMHPSHQLPKIYEATLDKPFDFGDVPKLLKGMVVEGKKARFDKIHKTGTIEVEIVLTQGIKRQIRVMLGILGYEVTRLRRTTIGGLRLGSLKPGEWKRIRPDEIQRWLLVSNPRPTRDSGKSTTEG